MCTCACLDINWLLLACWCFAYASANLQLASISFSIQRQAIFKASTQQHGWAEVAMLCASWIAFVTVEGMQGAWSSWSEVQRANGFTDRSWQWSGHREPPATQPQVWVGYKGPHCFRLSGSTGCCRAQTSCMPWVQCCAMDIYMRVSRLIAAMPSHFVHRQLHIQNSRCFS